MRLLPLLACIDPATFGDSERDLRPAGDSVRWSGYVMRSGDADAAPLTDGTVAFLLSEDDPVRQAVQPSPSEYPGYWSVELPPDAAVTVRIDGPGLRTAVWPLRTPHESASWTAGTLFGAEADWIDARFLRAAREGDLPPPEWRDDRVRAWGFWRDGAAGDCSLTTLGGAPVVCLATDATGALEAVDAGPFVSWYAWDLEPGALAFSAGGATGAPTRVELQAQGGVIGTFGWLVPAP